MSGNANDNKPKLACCCSSCHCLAIRHLCGAASVGVILIASYLAGLTMKPGESASANPLAGLISFAICLASLSKRDIKSPVQYNTVQRQSIKVLSRHKTIVPRFRGREKKREREKSCAPIRLSDIERLWNAWTNMREITCLGQQAEPYRTRTDGTTDGKPIGFSGTQLAVTLGKGPRTGIITQPKSGSLPG